MLIEIGPAAALIAIAAVTYLTRVGGLIFMDRMTITPRIERSLEALAGSVLVAIIVPAAVAGDLAAKVAVIAAILVMALTRNAVAAMAVGMAAAIAIRMVG